MRRITLFATALFLLAPFQTQAQARVEIVTENPTAPLRIGSAAKPGSQVAHVCVDFSQQAWLLAYAAPAKDAAKPCANKLMRRVTVQEYRSAAFKTRLRDWQKHDIMPELNVIDRIRDLVVGNPGVPVGLTWEGGMAITASDYDGAEKRLAAYQRDPEGYARSQWQTH